MPYQYIYIYIYIYMRRITERQEAAFQDWWRESRNHSLQPRSTSLPTASERIEALLQRLADRSNGAAV